MAGFWICAEMQFWKGSEYCRIPNIPGLQAYASVAQGFEYAWMWLNNAWINCSDYGKVLNMPGESFIGIQYASSSKYAGVRNMTRLWICQCYTGWWICMNKPEFISTMPQYAWIYLNNAEYAWICLHILE